MSVAYFDSSALVKLLIDEPGTRDAIEVWKQCDLVTSSRLAYPEVRAALSAASRNNVLTPDELRAAQTRWEEYWAIVRPVELTSRVECFAGTLADQQALRGADAIHLASALTIPNPSLVFACWDRRLHQAAMRNDLTVAPVNVVGGKKSG